MNCFGRKFKIAVFLLLLLICVKCFSASEVCSLAEEREVVRVGWFHSAMFQEGMADDLEKSGYCYDYLQKVSNYTNWKYEYVYGDWTELYHMLINGEIDLLGGVSMTEERQEVMLFPDTEMGTDVYYLYKHDDDSSISASDYSTLSGKKVGGIVDNRITTFTEQWIEDNNVNLEIVYFESFEEQEEAFARGDLDLLGQTIYNVLSLDGVAIVAKVGEEPFYLAVNQYRPELRDALNEAVAAMLETDSFILQDMQYENYGAILTSKTMKDSEKQWLAEHPAITVGYLDNYLPYSDTDEAGNATGIMVDVLDAIREALNIENSVVIQYKEFDNYNDMLSALKSGEINIAFPVYGNLWLLEQNGIDASSAVLSGTETLFYRGVLTENSIKTIAVNEKNGMQLAYVRKTFPEAEILEYGSIEECLDAVLKGEADGTVINTMRTALVTGNSRYSSLLYIQLPGDDERCFGVVDGEATLLQILNRGLSLIGSNFAIDQSYKYSGKLYNYTVWDFIKANMITVTLIILVIALVIISMLLYIIKKKERHIEEIASLNEELEQLRVAAVEADKSKTAFLFNMSHDIRTPMNAIIGYVELMQNRFDDKEACRDYLEKVKKSSSFLLSLINDVLEMARIESGKVEIEETVCSSVKVFNEVSSVYSELMAQKGISFTCSADVKTAYVYADSVKLNEIFLNLLSNAYKYTPTGGNVSMDLRELPSDREGYSAFEATVRDTGIGMSKEYLATIFEPFTRERNTTQSKTAGTGLGMPIARKLIELMGGTISVESEPGKGTAFCVKAEFRQAEASALAEIDEDKSIFSDLAGKRILLAEDNELNAEITREILTENGIQVDWAEDGMACVNMLDRAGKGYYNAILMDVQMPNMNGYEATRKIREKGDSIPIIAMTANAFEEDKREAMDAGMNGHLSKPISVNELLMTLNSVL